MDDSVLKALAVLVNEELTYSAVIEQYVIDLFTHDIDKQPQSQSIANMVREFEAVHATRDTDVQTTLYSESWLDHCSDEDFNSMFRMTRNTFGKLVEAIERIGGVEKMYGGGFRPVPVKKSCEIAVWYLTNFDSMKSVGEMFNVARSTVYRCVKSFCDALQRLSPEHNKWPSAQDCKRLRREYENRAEFSDNPKLWLHGDLPDIQQLLDGQDVPEKAGTGSQEAELLKQVIWSCRHPTMIDKEATSEFLDIMISDRIQRRMKSKSMTRKVLWQQIAAEMKVKGYNLGGDEEDKLNNKFKNLEKAYREFIQHMRSAGKKHKSPPLFFAKLHQLFGEKHSRHLGSAIDDASRQNDSSQDGPSLQCAVKITVDRPIRPTESPEPSMSQLEGCHEEDAKSTTEPPQQSKHTLMMTELVEIEEEDREKFQNVQEQQQTHFQELTDVMDRHHEEHQDTMKAFFNTMQQSNGKRKRPCEDDESQP